MVHNFINCRPIKRLEDNLKTIYLSESGSGNGELDCYDDADLCLYGECEFVDNEYRCVCDFECDLEWVFFLLLFFTMFIMNSFVWVISYLNTENSVTNVSVVIFITDYNFTFF